MNDLSQRLAREADQFTHRGGTELDLGQVLDRAGEIKRGRRMRATIVMAACVLAVAVPTTLIATKGHVDKPVTPSHHAKADTSPLTIDGLETGATPKTGWFQGKVWTGPDGTQTQVSGGSDPVAAATVGDSLLFSAASPSGMEVTLVPPVGGTPKTVPSWPVDGGIAVSKDGNLAAFVKPDGTPVVVREDGSPEQLPRIPRGSGFSAVGLSGDCAASSCTVWVNTHGKKPEVWTSTSSGTVTTTRPDMIRADDVLEGKDSDGGTVAGMISATDDGSCSAVGALDGSPEWSTCDHQLGLFSPDGEHLSAFPAYFDGAGSSELSVLDARTGAVVLDLHTTRDAYVSQTVWEDDEHLLAVVGNGPRTAVLRIGLDGRREYAVPPTATEPYTSPFVLPSR